MAVVHVPAAVAFEADGDLDDLVRVDADGVLETPLVVGDRVVELVAGVALESDRRGEVAFTDSGVGNVVADRVSGEDLERVEVEVEREGRIARPAQARGL
jgi:hypothetical protein